MGTTARAEFVRGDMYLTDMSHTKGHIAALSRAVWHPVDAHTFMTSAADSTVRIWDANDTSKQKTLIKLKGKNATSFHARFLRFINTQIN